MNRSRSLVRLLFPGLVLLAVTRTMPFLHAELTDGPPSSIAAPDGKSSVAIVQEPAPGADDNLYPFRLEVRIGDRVAAVYPTMGYLMGADWSPDGRYVAVTNRMGNSGDYLWIFTLPDGKAIKRPEDALSEKWTAAGLAAIEAFRPDATDANLDRLWLTGGDWTGPTTFGITLRARFVSGTYDSHAVVDLSRSPVALGKMKVREAR